MEYLSEFANIAVFFSTVVTGSLLLGIIFLRRQKASLKPVHYIAYNKDHFDRNFEFKCEYCGAVVSTTQHNCPQCGSTYGENKEYRRKKRFMNVDYMNYLMEQEERLSQEIEYIEKTMRALRTNMIMRPTFYNFDLGEPPVYRPATDFAFACYFCDTKLRGRSNDGKVCPNCGAGYKNNTDLLVQEAEERVEKRYFEEYQKLKEIEWQQNLKNEKKDRYISTKYAKLISFMTRNAKLIAIFIVALIFLLPYLIFMLVI